MGSDAQLAFGFGDIFSRRKCPGDVFEMAGALLRSDENYPDEVFVTGGLIFHGKMPRSCFWRCPRGFALRKFSGVNCSRGRGLIFYGKMSGECTEGTSRVGVRILVLSCTIRCVIRLQFSPP